MWRRSAVTAQLAAVEEQGPVGPVPTLQWTFPLHPAARFTLTSAAAVSPYPAAVVAVAPVALAAARRQRTRIGPRAVAEAARASRSHRRATFPPHHRPVAHPH